MDAYNAPVRKRKTLEPVLYFIRFKVKVYLVTIRNLWVYSVVTERLLSGTG